MFDKIDKLQEKIAKLRPLNKTELEKLRENFIIENTYNSNAIEGNTLTLREVALILQHDFSIHGKRVSEHIEVIGYKDAFYYILDNVNEPLTKQAIKNIHSLVLMVDRKNKGVFRNVGTHVLGITHKTSEPQEIESNIDELLVKYEEWKQQHHILKAIALLHLEFESIHPFIDGNGRTGRLLLNFELIKHGLLPVNIKFTDREKYYNSFDEYHINNNADYLTDLIANYEIEELEKYISMIDC